jgi:hypothetical protein
MLQSVISFYMFSLVEAKLGEEVLPLINMFVMFHILGVAEDLLELDPLLSSAHTCSPLIVLNFVWRMVVFES